MKRAMSKQQIDYASKRIHEIASDKIAKYASSMPAVPSLTDNEKIELIRSGKAKLKPDAKIFRDLGLCFAYPDKNEKKRIDRSIKIEQYSAKVNAAANIIKDRIVLIGDEAAVAAINDFEKEVITP